MKFLLLDLRLSRQNNIADWLCTQTMDSCLEAVNSVASIAARTSWLERAHTPRLSVSKKHTNTDYSGTVIFHFISWFSGDLAAVQKNQNKTKKTTLTCDLSFNRRVSLSARRWIHFFPLCWWYLSPSAAKPRRRLKTAKAALWAECWTQPIKGLSQLWLTGPSTACIGPSLAAIHDILKGREARERDR